MQRRRASDFSSLVSSSGEEQVIEQVQGKDAIAEEIHTGGSIIDGELPPTDIFKGQGLWRSGTVTFLFYL